MEGPCSISRVARPTPRRNLDFTSELLSLPKFLRDYPLDRDEGIIFNLSVEASTGMDVDRRRCSQPGEQRATDRSFDDRVQARACKAIERRMIRFVRPMSLSGGGTPCHGVQQLKLDLI